TRRTRRSAYVAHDTERSLARATSFPLLFRLPNYSLTEGNVTRVSDPYTDRRRARARGGTLRRAAALQGGRDAGGAVLRRRLPRARRHAVPPQGRTVPSGEARAAREALSVRHHGDRRGPRARGPRAARGGCRGSAGGAGRADPDGRRHLQRFEHAAAIALGERLATLTSAQRQRIRAALSDLRAVIGTNDFTSSSHAEPTLRQSTRGHKETVHVR